MTSNPVRGKALELTFKDGPMAGKAITHAFHSDGSLDFHMGDATKKTHVDKVEVAKVSDDVYAASYLGSSGYTLSLVLDFANHKLVAFSSNEKELMLQHGTFAEAS